MGFRSKLSGNHLEAALEDLCNQAAHSLARGNSLIILSDRDLPEDLVPIPALLATSAVNRFSLARGSGQRGTHT